MGNKKEKLTEAEWIVMEYLWLNSPATGREITEAMEEQTGWNRSTTLTLLRRMENKNMVSTDDSGTKKLFSAAVPREDAAMNETEHFIKRIYKGSVSMMLSALTRRQSLSQEEIDDIYAMLKQMEDEGRNA